MLGKSKIVLIIGLLLVTSISTLAIVSGLSMGDVLGTNKRSLTISTASESMVYDGTELTAEGYEITDGSLKKGHTMTVTYVNSITDVGTVDNAISVKIIDEADVDVTSDYEFNYNLGTLEVVPRDITFKSKSIKQVYGGKDVDYQQIETIGSLVPGHVAVPSYTQYFTKIGTTENSFSVAIEDEYGQSVSKNYNITCQAGNITINPCVIKLTTETLKKLYDATELTSIIIEPTDYDEGHAGYTITDGTLPDTVKIVVTNHTSVTEVTSDKGIENEFEIKFVLKDDEEIDVTDLFDYSFSNNNGTLSVLPRTITITTESKKDYYDGNPLTCLKYSFSGNDSDFVNYGTKIVEVATTGDNKEFNIVDSDDEIIKSFVIIPDKDNLPSQTVVNSGTYDTLNDIDFKIIIKGSNPEQDVTEFFNIALFPGKLTVEKREIIVTTDGITQVYDGTPINNTNYTCDEAQFPEGFGIKENSIVFPERTNVGEFNNTITFTIVKKDTYEDVTEYFDIKYKTSDPTSTPTDKGAVNTITAREIIINTLGSNTVFDGQEHNNTNWEYDISSPYEVVIGETISFDLLTSLKDVGKKMNTESNLEIYYIDAETSEKVSTKENYLIKFNNYGDIEVTPCPITITTSTASKVYDTSPLESLKFTIDTVNNAAWNINYDPDIPNSNLLPSEYGIYKVNIQNKTQITNVTENPVNNVLSFYVVDEEGKKTDNFSIDDKNGITYGQLSITPYNVEIQTPSDNKVYDGYPLENTNYTLNTTLPNNNIIHTAKSWTKITNVNTAAVDNDITLSFTLYGEDITKNFLVSYDPDNHGQLTVTKRDIVFETAGASKTYDGTALIKKEFINDPSTSLAETDDFSELYFTKSITDVNMVEINSTPVCVGIENEVYAKIVNKDGVDTTDNYNFRTEYGILTITPKDITLATDSASKTYDGTELTNKTNIFDNTQMCGDDKISFEIIGSQLDVGQSPNMVDNITITKVINGVTTDCKNNYNITPNYGQLVVNKRDLYIKSASATKTVDGTSLTFSGTTYIFDTANPDLSQLAALDNFDYSKIVYGEILEYKTNGSQTDVGESKNTFDYIKISKANNGGSGDSTNNYNIIKDYGALKVEKDYGVTLTSSGSVNSMINNNGFGLPENYDDSSSSIIIGQVSTTETGYVYLKSSSFQNLSYKNGQWSWSVAPSYTPINISGTDYSNDYLTGFALDNYGTTTETINLRSYYNYLLPYYLCANTTGYSIPTSDVLYYTEDDYYEYSVVRRIININNLSKYSYPSDISGSVLTAVDNYTQYVKDSYLEISDQVKSYLKKYILTSSNGLNFEKLSKIDADQIDTYYKTVINKISEYLDGPEFTYSKDYDRCIDTNKMYDPTILFLQTKEGICQHYALAATMMFRYFGIPARYTVGYLANVTDKDAWNDITDKDAHAWVEVYHEGLGWIKVEVTKSWGGSSGSGDNYINNSEDESYTIIQVSPSTIEHEYDTNAHSWNEVYGNDPSKIRPCNDGGIIIDEQFYKCYYRITVTGDRTEIGLGQSTITSIEFFTDNTGTTPLPNVLIVKNDGIIKIYKDKLKIASSPATKPYDGTPLSNNSLTITHGAFGDPDYGIATLIDASIGKYELTYNSTTIYIVANTNASITEVDQHGNTFTFKIYDSSDNDITDNFLVEQEVGELVITKIKIYIELDDVVATYDENSDDKVYGKVRSYTGDNLLVNNGYPDTISIKISACIPVNVIAYLEYTIGKDDVSAYYTDEYGFQMPANYYEFIVTKLGSITVTP